MAPLPKFLFMLLVATTLILKGGFAAASTPTVWPGFASTGTFDEQEHVLRFEPGITVTINAPLGAPTDEDSTVTLILFALPNGNSTAWTAGARMTEGMDWHYDIQHIAAQVRWLRALQPERHFVVAYLEADGKSWPTWRRTHGLATQLVPQLVAAVRASIPHPVPSVILTGHSGGGSLTFGFLNAHDTLPHYLERIALLDSNYAYDDTEQGHGDKLVQWLQQRPGAFLFVMAYDDRNVELNGKRIVSDTGGTWRATDRMTSHIGKTITLTEGSNGAYRELRGSGIRTLQHRNPDLKILHTVMVGEYNGLIHAVLSGTKHEAAAGGLEGPRVYTEYIGEMRE